MDDQVRVAAVRVRAALRDVGFGEAELAARLGPRWNQPPQPHVLAAWLERLGTDALATVTGLLLLGEPTPAATLSAAGVEPDDLLATGLATEESGVLATTARLAPWFDFVVASDRPDRLGTSDFVLGPSLSGQRCADLTVRRPAARALDVGTGAGIQALLASRHADHVVGTDVNERALWFAERNAALNGVANVEWRVGSWLEPVAGETFDLVVCNAPYVVTAEPGQLFRDGGMAGDAVSELLLRGLPTVLAGGGWATVLVGWLADPAEPLQRPLAWLDGARCGAILLTDRVFSLHEHAEAWASLPPEPTEARRTALTRWAAGLRAFGFEQVREGAVVLHGGARPWRVAEGLAAELRNPAGAHLERLAAAAEWLEDRTGPLLDERLRVVGTVRLEGVRTLLDGEEEPGMVEVRVLDGLGSMAKVDAITARALALLPDAGTPRVAVRRAALELGVPEDRLAGMEADAAPVVHELVRLGVLAPAAGPELAPVPLVPGRMATAGRVLAELGYEEAAVRELLGQPGPKPIETADRDGILRRVDRSPLGLLATLFLVGDGVETSDVQDLLGEEALRVLLAAGLLVETDDGVEATVRVAPYHGLLLASDRADGLDGPERVPGAHPATWMADRLTVRRNVDRALDLGTGCGALAILAARHARHVVATDVNPRALAFTAANAELNGCTNVELREGSWFEPVAGERFDLLVSNPPFVLSPEQRYLYRDGGLTHEVSRSVLAGVAEHLVEGGDATVLVHWRQPVDDPQAAPAAWLAGAPLDAWLLVSGVEGAGTYARSWNTWLRADPAAYAERVDAWERSLRDAGVERIGKGAVVARRTVGSGVVRTTPLELDRLGERAGEQLDRMLGAARRLADAGDDPMAVAGLTAAVVPGVSVTQTAVATDGGLTPVKVHLRVPEGLGLEIGLDPHALPLVEALTSPRLLGDAALDVAAGLGLPPEAVAPAALGLARVLVELGVLDLT